VRAGDSAPRQRHPHGQLAVAQGFLNKAPDPALRGVDVAQTRAGCLVDAAWVKRVLDDRLLDGTVGGERHLRVPRFAWSPGTQSTIAVEPSRSSG
jgi:hypothetical protein